MWQEECGYRAREAIAERLATELLESLRFLSVWLYGSNYQQHQDSTRRAGRFCVSHGVLILGLSLEKVSLSRVAPRIQHLQDFYSGIEQRADSLLADADGHAR